MSNASKYSGLAGTVLLGTLLGLNYTQYAKRKAPLAEKGPAYDPSNEVQPGSLFDKTGQVIPLGRTDLPGMDSVRRFREYIPGNVPLVLCVALSSLWAVRALTSMNRVLSRRYSDVVYQIRRPDIIHNRLRAWGVLGVGCAIVPLVALGGLYAANSADYSGLERDREILTGSLRDSGDVFRRAAVFFPFQPDKSALAAAVSNFGKTVRDGLKPM
jgi:hypothetical protein